MGGILPRFFHQSRLEGAPTRRYALRVATGVNEAQGMTETAAEMGQSDPGPVPPDPFPVVGALWPFRRVTKRKATIPGEKPNFQTEAVNEFGRK